jgi:phosphodiesterase/alkaline phosphatase D-like protein
MKHWIYLLSLAGIAHATPIEVLNPSGEINSGVDRSPISGAAVIGWTSNGGQVINDGTDYGNGGWRLSCEDSQEIRQMTGHSIQTGASYSLRFDAAMFATGSSNGNVTLIGGATKNGNFNADTSGTNSRTFADTPEWQNLGTGNQTAEATKTDNAVDGTRNAVVKEDGTRIFGNDTGHTLQTGDTLRVSYQWWDGSNWNDAADRIGVSIFTTNDNTLTGTRTIIETRLSALSAVNGAYQTETADFAAIPASANGKRLFVLFQGVDGNSSNTGFARLDNFSLLLTSGDAGVDPASRVIIADLYVDNNGTPLPVATRTYPFKTTTVGSWNHYHLAVPAGTLDTHAGKTLGIRFRSQDLGSGNYQSVDNVRLDFWPGGSPDGSFTTNWNGTPNQRWAGPGYWANRLQDWQVSGSRVQFIDGTRERLTLHRPGTSIRGNGGNFTFSVRTGLNTGTNSTGSRAGFLLGAAPNVDWRGALLVHDGLGRDFGLFIGITGGGNLVIEDYSTGSVTALASAAATGGFASNTRLNLAATYNSGPGTYTLTLTAFDNSNTPIGTINTSVPSDRVLGAFGLLSNFGSSVATHWFDDFTGSGAALHPETDRHLAILGAMHTLSKGKLKLTAQLSPLSLASNPTVALDTWNGASWDQIATAPVDNTDNLSSYTATFALSGWNDTVDKDYRLRINIEGSDYTWTGTIRRDPVDKEELVIAMTTCQRINDGNIQTNGFDWSPVMLWQPHVASYLHIAKHDPDVLLAHGDQIYEGQPTSPDKSSATDRQLDYLYKWNLWVLQVRDLTREVPTVAIPDDHDVFQGNLWGEGGISTTDMETGGYTEPASWVKMVERTQTSNLPDPDPYNSVQPPPPANTTTGIGVYFTGMTYGRLGFAVLEDRKFKTGTSNPPASGQQHLLGERQHEFLRQWNKDWAGQDLKLVVSQSPLTNLRTHASTGYSYFLNDKDTHGWPAHRRNEAWRLLRVSRMFQLAGDQHLATLVHHGADGPRDAGISFTAPAMANFFPRSFNPVHNASGTTPTVSPYKGDYFFNGAGTLPDGITPNRTASDPQHFAVLGAANSREYYQQTTGINPANYHDRGAGYGITRVNRITREITVECWPIHADPEYPSTGSQFADWPQSFRQTDNDGRAPTGYLPLIDTHWRSNPVVRVFDESTGELVNSLRIRGTRYRPPVYNNATTYRVEIAYDDATLSETRNGQTASPPGSATIRSFRAVQPGILSGASTLLEWDVASPATLSINQGIGNVMASTVDGIGYLEVAPTADTTYSLTLNGTIVAQTTIRFFPGRSSWDATHFTPAELANPSVSNGNADHDLDGYTNDQEFQFQTNPRDNSSLPQLQGEVEVSNGEVVIDFECSSPVGQSIPNLIVEAGSALDDWNPLPSNSYIETGRQNNPALGTTRVSIRVTEPLAPSTQKKFYRARWLFQP